MLLGLSGCLWLLVAAWVEWLPMVACTDTGTDTDTNTNTDTGNQESNADSYTDSYTYSHTELKIQN